MVKIFISYRRADSRKDAGRIYDRLVAAFGKEQVFKDVDDIPIGKDFRGVLREAVAQCDVQLVIIGTQWLNIKGEDGQRRLDNPGDFVRIEVESALQRDSCQVIPVLVDSAIMPAANDLPLDLRELVFKNAAVVRDDPDFHRDVDRIINKLRLLSGENSNGILNQLPSIISQASAQSKRQLAKVEADAVRAIIGEPFEWCEVPSGDFLYGEGNLKPILPTFVMAKYPITYRQFQTFLDDPDGIQDHRWWHGLAATDSLRQEPGDQEWKIAFHPRENVSWYEAVAFCRWLSWRLGSSYDLNDPNLWGVRLPKEFEWEKAARGTDGRLYPYGNDFDKLKSNTKEGGIGKTSSVTAYPTGASPYGVLDMSGNVWEWCLTNYDKTAPEILKTNINFNSLRVLRGGSCYSSRNNVRTVSRLDLTPARNFDIGFRVMSPFSP